jgi:hypothetical protein
VGLISKKIFTVVFVATTFSFLSLRTAQTKEYSLDKEQTSYDDLQDALRLSLKG